MSGLAPLVQRFLSCAWSLKEFLSDECDLWRTRGVRPRPLAILRGFHSISPTLYRFDASPRAHFLSDLARLKAGRINGHPASILNDKILFERVFSRWLPVPPNVAMIRRGVMRTFDDLSSEVDGSSRPIDWTEVAARCPDGVVAKPIGGGAGKGVAVIRPVEGGQRYNGEAIGDDALRQRLGQLDQFLLVPFVRQATRNELLHPATTNTVRVLTMVDPDDGSAFVARAVQRIGVRASVPVDNWTQGGLSAMVDPESGRLGRGATKPRLGPPVWHERHPETDAQIAGETVPNWPRIRDELLRVAAMFPMIPYIGWDVIPTDDGYAVIEGNYRSDVNLLQIHGGLLAEPRVRRFYLNHGVIGRRGSQDAALDDLAEEDSVAAGKGAKQ